jgi:hypothetical protein
VRATEPNAIRFHRHEVTPVHSLDVAPRRIARRPALEGVRQLDALPGAEGRTRLVLLAGAISPTSLPMVLVKRRVQDDLYAEGERRRDPEAQVDSGRCFSGSAPTTVPRSRQELPQLLRYRL